MHSFAVVSGNSPRQGSLLIDDSTLHHETNVLQHSDVFKRISLHADHIRKIPRL